MPYGETLVDEHTTAPDPMYLTAYKFNGKEMDAETGLYYYGARYYEPELAMWYGVDKLAEKYVNMSSYNYCVNNPIRNVDIYGFGPEDRIKKARSMVNKPYKQETDSKLRTEDTEAALEFMDCSEFLCRILADDGLTNGVQHMSSSEIHTYLSNKDDFEHSYKPNKGDIAVWKGHVGLVTETRDDNTFKLIHARGEGKLSKENGNFTTADKYRSSTFYGFYRPKSESTNPQSNSENNPVIAISSNKTHEFKQGKLTIGQYLINHTSIGTGLHSIGLWLDEHNL